MKYHTFRDFASINLVNFSDISIPGLYLCKARSLAAQQCTPADRLNRGVFENQVRALRRTASQRRTRSRRLSAAVSPQPSEYVAIEYQLSFKENCMLRSTGKAIARQMKYFTQLSHLLADT